LSITKRTKYKFVWIYAIYIFGNPISKIDFFYLKQFYSYIKAYKVLKDLNIIAGSELKYYIKLLKGGGSQILYSLLMGIKAKEKIR
jgi:hypothetical protein